MSNTTQLQEDLRSAFEDYGNEVFLVAAKALYTQNTRITELEALLADAQKDAARYQWLRNDSGSSYIGIYRDPHSNCRRYLVSTEADNFIDAAMQKEAT